MKTRLTGAVALVLVQLGLTSCDKMPLLAPTSSTVSVTSAALVLPTGGSTEVTAFVAESGGTPVQNGTVVRFTTNLGRLAPVEVQTRNGLAITTFLAGDIAGEAEVKATSGVAAGSTATPNSVKISIGAAAITSLTLRANPGSVPARGGTSQIVATVMGATGRALSGIQVNFATSRGTLSATSGVSDSAGEVRTVLTTDREATVTATAGAQTATVSITRQDPLPIPVVALTSVKDLATAMGQRFTFTATVSGNDDTTRPVRFEWNFGDEVTAVTSTGTAIHFYDDELVRRTVTVRVVLENGDTISATTEVSVDQFPP
ncbi:MAG TPA: Ig-like domain-containing protein [Vicinamibacterales bacterium]